jgi:myotubularin-related protein 6/7/8
MWHCCRANGAGYENTAFYLNCKYQCMGIENIHVMRDSLAKLLDGVFYIRLCT